MSDILGLDTLFAELTLALGLALVIGNTLAVVNHRRGRRPEGAAGDLRVGRVVFLLGIGTVLTVWGGISTIQKLTAGG